MKKGSGPLGSPTEMCLVGGKKCAEGWGRVWTHAGIDTDRAKEPDTMKLMIWKNGGSPGVEGSGHGRGLGEERSGPVFGNKGTQLGILPIAR